MSDNTDGVLIRFTRSARRRRIGRASARYVMATVSPESMTTTSGAAAWSYIGADERGRELEIIAIEMTPSDGERYLLVIHVMPTRLRG
jgi:hypothetical protein